MSKYIVRRFVFMEKKNNKSLRAWEIAALMALSLFLCAGTWAQARQQSISSALVRLHVIAVSDDEEGEADECDTTPGQAQRKSARMMTTNPKMCKYLSFETFMMFFFLIWRTKL